MFDEESVTTDGESQDQQVGGDQEDRRREDDRDNLYNLRETHFEALHRFFGEIFDAETLNLFTANELIIRKRRLEKHFADFENAHLLYRQVCILASNDIYEQTESRFMDAMSKLEDRLQVQGVPAPSSFSRSEIAANSTMATQGSTIIRVETARPPQIGTFDGSPADWPAFRDLFLAEVHNRDYDPVTKLLYLREACVKGASATLGPWQPTNENYKAAWEVMMAAYNDEYHVIHGIIGNMCAVQKYEKEDYGSLRAILDALNGSTRQLETISTPAVLWDQMWIHLAKQRMPKKTLDSWEQFRNRGGATKLPTLDEFKDFLDTKSKGRREFENDTTGSMSKGSSVGHTKRSESSGNRFRPYEKSKPSRGENPFRSQKNEASGSGGPTRCVMPGCSQTHYLGQCDAFRGLPLTERVEFTRQHRLCKCCLTTGHYAFSCSRSGCSKCPEDKQKHHFRLCPKMSADLKPNMSTAKKAPEPSKQ